MTGGPVFILGMMHRSGTNFLWDLVRSHPDCAVRPPIWEDWLLRHADALERYSRAVEGSWDQAWGDTAAERRLLLRRLGDGLTSFLAEGADGLRPVTKTPSVESLELFPTLFPDANLLLLVRDGRATVESAVRSFGWTYESCMRTWAAAARTVLAFDEQHRDGPLRYTVVRYEDLVADLDRSLAVALRTCGLDPDRYDFSAAAALPVRGSSELRTGGEKEVHWEPVDRQASFRPKSRGADWDEERRRRFARIAGAEQRALGYDLDDIPTAGVAERARDAAAALAWRGRRRLAPAKGRVVHAIGARRRRREGGGDG